MIVSLRSSILSTRRLPPATCFNATNQLSVSASSVLPFPFLLRSFSVTGLASAFFIKKVLNCIRGHATMSTIALSMTCHARACDRNAFVHDSVRSDHQRYLDDAKDAAIVTMEGRILSTSFSSTLLVGTSTSPGSGPAASSCVAIHIERDSTCTLKYTER